ncbi:hypothetical protein CIB95_08585 [Lottiidibacillus patelloidae]|uniref:NETI motif-containing protein n=1 Tax=Lottiidibacillus patelloidae TaxID=2670334 RepID=A0A263BSX6_9BACI|nr:NETI motif-containing protein [Lottiidibacillus patelloidae]OZM56820.1 hypothetical protein CIB95_08585 [Lottiidibacillus patelloidae]
MKKQKKRKFEVLDGETIDQCLERMEKEGYTPVRRMERPVFEEIVENKEKIRKPFKQQIIFEGKLKGEK